MSAAATVIERVCSWCNARMGEKDGEGVEGISHGMCDACFENVVGESPAVGPQAVQR